MSTLEYQSGEDLAKRRIAEEVAKLGGHATQEDVMRITKRVRRDLGLRTYDMSIFSSEGGA